MTILLAQNVCGTRTIASSGIDGLSAILLKGNQSQTFLVCFSRLFSLPATLPTGFLHSFLDRIVCTFLGLIGSLIECLVGCLIGCLVRCLMGCLDAFLTAFFFVQFRCCAFSLFLAIPPFGPFLIFP